MVFRWDRFIEILTEKFIFFPIQHLGNWSSKTNIWTVGGKSGNFEQQYSSNISLHVLNAECTLIFIWASSTYIVYTKGLLSVQYICGGKNRSYVSYHEIWRGRFCVNDTDWSYKMCWLSSNDLRAGGGVYQEALFWRQTTDHEMSAPPPCYWPTASFWVAAFL